MLSRRLLRIKVVKGLYSHFKSGSDSLTASRKNLTLSINKTYELYHQMLFLIVETAQYAQQRIDLALNKKLPTHEDLHPNLRFVSCPVIAQIRESKELNEYLAAHSLGWGGYPELIKRLFCQLSESDFYKAYMSAPQCEYRDGIKLLEEFYVRIVAPSEDVDEVLEDQSALWTDDTDFALLMTLRTISACKPAQTELPLLAQYKNADDRNFAPELFSDAIVNYDKYMEYVERYTKNWDVDRIAFIDCLIMVAAIAELVTFPTIPVKVTLDEYIEISKYYSTPGSSTFINGILDKIVDELTSKSLIVKEGRGLV